MASVDTSMLSQRPEEVIAVLTGLISGGAATASKAVGILGGLFGVIPWVISLVYVNISEGELGLRRRNGRTLVRRRTRVIRKGMPRRRNREPGDRWPFRRKIFVEVEKGEPRIEYPGGHFKLPGLYTIGLIDTKLQPCDLPQRTVMCGDGQQRIFHVSLEMQRGTTGKQLRRSEFQVGNEKELLANAAAEALVIVAALEDMDEFNVIDVGKKVTALCATEVLKEFGMHLRRTRITGVAPAPEQRSFDGMKNVADAIRSLTGFIPVPPSN